MSIHRAVMKVLLWEFIFLPSSLLLPLISQPTPLTGKWVFTMKNMFNSGGEFLGDLIPPEHRVSGRFQKCRVWWEPMVECTWREWQETLWPASLSFVNIFQVLTRLSTWAWAGLRAGTGPPAYVKSGNMVKKNTKCSNSFIQEVLR